MFERYSERARRVLFFARLEAHELGSTSIDPEHLLLGLIRERKGMTMRIFARWHLLLDAVRDEVASRTVIRDKIPTSAEVPFSTETVRVFQFAVDEADASRDPLVTTEHLLIGILRQEQSVAARVLLETGMRPDAVRGEIHRLANEGRCVDPQS